MNAKQEILALLEITENDDWNDMRNFHERIRAILETHELVPVDQHAEMQRLLLPYAGLKLRDGEVMPVDGEGIVECLTRVLQAFESLRITCGEQWGRALTEKKPFDPTLCGFQWMGPHSDGLWENAEWQILKTADGNLAVARSKLQSWSTAYLEHAPWPATQSDGETLLRLLGVLAK